VFIDEWKHRGLDIKINITVNIGYWYFNKCYVTNYKYFPYVSSKLSVAFYYSTLLSSSPVSFITYSTPSSSISRSMPYTLLIYSHTYNYYYCTGDNIHLTFTVHSINFTRNFRVTHSWNCNLLFFLSIIEE
jgi:hypothetical protein